VKADGEAGIQWEWKGASTAFSTVIKVILLLTKHYPTVAVNASGIDEWVTRVE
jgi:hypothetical protein